MKLPETINETSFAVCVADVTALVLDAIALTGVDRRQKLTQALGRLDKAYMWAHTQAELAVAAGLTGTINKLDEMGAEA